MEEAGGGWRRVEWWERYSTKVAEDVSFCSVHRAWGGYVRCVGGVAGALEGFRLREMEGGG